MELFSKSPLIIISVYFLVSLISIPYASSLTFNLTDISPQNQKDIILEGAYISTDGIQVTPESLKPNQSMAAGRATYARLLHLWNNASGELASFTTNFTFVINSNGHEDYGYGLVFFLAQNNSVIPSDEAMGLPVNTTNDVPISPFVAVEFDTSLSMRWDPEEYSIAFSADHVGIDINNLTSVRYRRWWSNVTSGGECEASVTYDSVLKNLSVAFTSFANNTLVQQFGLDYITDLRYELPEWVIFGFAASTSGYRLEQHTVKSWSFSSSNLQGDEKVEQDNVVKGKGRTGLVVGVIVGVCVLVTFLAVFAFVLCRKEKKKKSRGHAGEKPAFDDKMKNELEMGIGPKSYPYHELARSTSDFADKEKLGEGGFGSVYKGFLKDLDTNVAVKRVSKSSEQGIKEYASEIRTIGRLSHRNLVKLIGWCHEKKELLLVYEFMENGSLDLHLFKGRSLLPWKVRYKIAQGLASALLYLHEECQQCVLHRDIKSSNILLDSNFNAKLGDFGLAKLVDHEKGSQTTMLAGTRGYMAPECYVNNKASKESDVFSFGVVALEIACGRKPIDNEVPERQIKLVEWVWELYGMSKLLDAIDPRLGTDFEEEQVKHLMIVGLWCAHPDADHRPSVRQVIQVLNFEVPSPTLPSEMPVPKYIAPPKGASAILESIQN